MIGRRKGAAVDFEVQSGSGIVMLAHGSIDGNKLSGIYVVRALPELRLRQPDLVDQNGRWEATK